MKSRGTDFNLVVVGAGAAGLVAAYIGSALKAKVALIEKHKMGGDCLNTGCVPSKALLRTAKVLALQNQAKALGLRSVNFDWSFPEVMERVRRVISKIEPNDSELRYSSLGVSCFQGDARVLSPREVEVDGRRLRTKAVVIASGAGPVMPGIEGLASMSPLTSETIWNLEKLPEHLLVLGGGAIGCELAQAFRRLGSRVTIVEKGPRLLGREDKDVGEHIQAKLQREGARVLLGTEPRRFLLEQGGKTLLCGSPEERISFDQVLVALGRKASVSGFGLEALGVRLRPDGTILTDIRMRTSVKGIYAAGDCTGPFQFTHFASLTGSTAAINALLWPARRSADYRFFPRTAYTDPEVARVGLNEMEAREQGVKFESTVHHFSELDRAIAEESAEGFVKVLTVPGKDRILGATIVGSGAGELITEFTLAMQHGLGLRAILSTIHPYPTLMEANRFVAGAWARSHASPMGLSLLRQFHSLKRMLPF